VRERYFELGYPYVRVSSRLVPEGSDLEMRVEILEGPQVHVREIVFDGKARVPERVLRAEMPLRPGDPLDPRKLIRAESLLSKYVPRVRVTSEEKDPGRIVVTLRASERLQATYALDVDSSSAIPGVSIDLKARNLLRAVTPNVFFSQKEFERRARAGLSMPALLHRGQLSVNVTVQDRKTTTDGERPARGAAPEELVRSLTRIASATQNVQVAGHWLIDYGVELKHVTTEAPFFLVPIEVDVSKARVSLVRDTRDHLLDPRNGRYWTISLSYAPRTALGDLTFVKGYGQLAVYRALAPQLTWAQSYRVGLGKGLRGSELFSEERFATGGASSVRGYATDWLGPLDPISGEPESGEGLVVFNQELRYHHPSGLGAVLFYDGGNVFRHLADIEPKLRHSIGAGLRYDSPVGLLRIDLGVPMKRRTVDDAYQIFFSLGQAF